MGETHSVLLSGNGAQPHDIMTLMMESRSSRASDLEESYSELYLTILRGCAGRTSLPHTHTYTVGSTILVLCDVL